MKIHGQPRRSIESDEASVRILDQTLLPHCIEWRDLDSLHDAAEAISTMRVRGAPLIGATAAWGMALAMRESATDAAVQSAHSILYATRPTAVNLRWALDRMQAHLLPLSPPERAARAWQEAARISEEDVRTNYAIGCHGAGLLQSLAQAKAARGGPVHVMTHCNAGWLACVDRGTALAPIYEAHDTGMELHVWVSETRPRGQGAALTAWELREHGVPHTLIADNNAGHLLQRGLVDVCIVGADRVTAAGDAANKIGTYLKALAARANDVPFYVAMPVSTIDWTITDGVREIPIEQRSEREVTHIFGLDGDGVRREVLIAPPNTVARNDAFDVTPASLISGLITERGICAATIDALAALRAAQF